MTYNKPQTTASQMRNKIVKPPTINSNTPANLIRRLPFNRLIANTPTTMPIIVTTSINTRSIIKVSLIALNLYNSQQRRQPFPLSSLQIVDLLIQRHYTSQKGHRKYCLEQLKTSPLSNLPSFIYHLSNPYTIMYFNTCDRRFTMLH